MTSRWLDSPTRYGRVTRILHWGMAVLLAWQFLGMVFKVTLGRRHDLTALFASDHKSVGATLALLILLRVLWALGQWRRRPRYPATALGRAAVAGHAALYLLMLYIPTVALMREYGRTGELVVWGVQVFSGRAEAVPWLIAPASASHGLMGWLLFALIIGHVVMALVHQFHWRDQTLSRMAGRTGTAGG